MHTGRGHVEAVGGEFLSGVIEALCISVKIIIKNLSVH